MGTLKLIKMAKLTDFTEQELHLLIDTAQQALMPQKCVPSEDNYIKFDRFQFIKAKYKYPNYHINDRKIISKVIREDFNIPISKNRIYNFKSKQKKLNILNKQLKKEQKYDGFVQQIQIEKDIILTSKQVTKIWEMKSTGENIKLIYKYIDDIVSQRLN